MDVIGSTMEEGTKVGSRQVVIFGIRYIDSIWIFHQGSRHLKHRLLKLIL